MCKEITNACVGKILKHRRDVDKTISVSLEQAAHVNSQIDVPITNFLMQSYLNWSNAAIAVNVFSFGLFATIMYNKVVPIVGRDGLAGGAFFSGAGA